MGGQPPVLARVTTEIAVQFVTRLELPLRVSTLSLREKELEATAGLLPFPCEVIETEGPGGGRAEW
jgi:hypothetical protein